jgi:hypothetical protein
VRLAAATGDQQRTPALPLHLGDDRDGREPALVRIPPRHLAEQRAVAEAAAQLRHDARLRGIEGIRREAVGNDHRVDPDVPHAVLHVAAHRGDQRRPSQAFPRDPLEAEGVVGVPEDAHPIAKVQAAEQPIEVKDRVRGLPLLGENHRPITQPQAGRQLLVHQEGERPGELRGLPFSPS